MKLLLIIVFILICVKIFIFIKSLLSLYFPFIESIDSFIETEAPQVYEFLIKVYSILMEILPYLFTIAVVVVAFKILRVIIFKSKSKQKYTQDEIGYDDDFNVKKDEKENIFFSDSYNALTSLEQVVNSFIKLYKHQFGESDAPSMFKALKEFSTKKMTVYELKIGHRGDWKTRRMSIGPLGEESGSKSKCFYVIYDDHLVVKIPPSPLTNFEDYIDSIRSERKIADKLSPKECIVPGLYPILKRIENLPFLENLSQGQIEEEYIKWVRKYPKYKKYLMIGGSFVYFMDLAKYRFLGEVLGEIHDTREQVNKEILSNKELIWDIHNFEARYGRKRGGICYNIQKVYEDYDKEFSNLLGSYQINTSAAPIFKRHEWFLSNIAKGTADIDESLPVKFINEFNIIGGKVINENKYDIDSYLNIIRGYVNGKNFSQNKSIMGSIVTNLVELLAWLRKKGIAIRDLKPDNLIVAGSSDNYPNFLKSYESFKIGLIDVETSVDFTPNDNYILQPILAGTPFYATPSHFMLNKQIQYVFKDLKRIFYLQDCFAILIMMYKIVTGERLFEDSARLLFSIRSMIQEKSDEQGDELVKFIKNVSKMYWCSVVVEFSRKMNEKQQDLNAVYAFIPDSAKDIFIGEFTREKKRIEKFISSYVENHKFSIDNTKLEHLINASPESLMKIITKLENALKLGKMQTDKNQQILYLVQFLEKYKIQIKKLEDFIHMFNQIETKLEIYSIIEILFNIVKNSMYLEEWGDLFSPHDEVITQGDLVDESLYEATL
ncbi:MAG: hypothetical protein HQK76_05885 [Desulfobacterales bacterium]|nr:hypothetical protein [Desulfobacterales bacterium]